MLTLARQKLITYRMEPFQKVPYSHSREEEEEEEALRIMNWSQLRFAGGLASVLKAPRCQHCSVCVCVLGNLCNYQHSRTKSTSSFGG